LDISVPYVCLQSHLPNERVEWWSCPIPLRKEGAPRSVEVRNVVFDLQLTTEGFLEVLEDFEECGVDLYQFHNPMPATFNIDKLFERRSVEVLTRNGFQSRFYLPHPQEVAVYWSLDRSHLEELTVDVEVRDILIVQKAES
jgi:hypothetical protein